MDTPSSASTPIGPLRSTKVLTEENIQEIKDRVVRAATEGLSQIAHGGAHSALPSPSPASSANSFAYSYTSSSHHNVHGTEMPPTSARSATSATSARQLARRSSSMWNFHDRDLFPLHALHRLPAAHVPVAEQERIVIGELLSCLMGVGGSYIAPGASNNDAAAPVSDYDVDDDDSGELAPIQFSVSDRLSVSLRAQVLEIVPLASDYSCVQRFSQLCADGGSGGGQVQQALGAALRTLIFEYYTFLVQLESEQLSHQSSRAAPEAGRARLTLTKLLFFVRPTMAVFRTLAHIMRHLHRHRLHGADILTHLHDSITTLTGAPAAQDIVVQLLQLAARPYMEMLHLWIHKGIILDAAQEFLVADNEHIRTDFIHIDHYSAEYWEKRYTVRAERVPSFVRTHADRVLRAGKYLNVIRQCADGGQQFEDAGADADADLDRVDVALRSAELQAIPFSALDARVHGAAIEAAYTRAAQALLRVLVTDADLMGHLQSVKRYLLLHQGDFINQFMDAAEKELAKNVDRVQPMRLDSLLGLTLRVASTKYDRYNEDLHCQLFPFELCKQMEKIHLAGTSAADADDSCGWHYRQPEERINLTGLECFAFRYEVSWPVSLVLNHFAVLEYQMLFRQLFYCKHVERQLCKVWKENNNANKFAPATAELYRSAFTLRQRMMSAVQNIEYYMMIEVIEPTWHEFVAKLDAVSNVDEVLLVHQDFLDDCLYNCMLKTPELLRAVTKLCNICLAFCKFIQKAQEHFVDAEMTSMLRSDDSSDSDSDVEQSAYKAQSESSMAPTETFAERIKRFDLEFTFVLIGLLKQINEITYENPNSKLINLVHRINFNSFYNTHLDQMSCKNAKVNLKPPHVSGGSK